MRKIDEWTINSIISCAGVYCNDNTVVRVAPDGVKGVELFGNKILHVNKMGVVFFTLARWNTVTTRAHLNALLHYYFNIGVTSRGGVPYLWGRTFTDVQLEAGAWYKVIYNHTDGAIDIVKVTTFD